MTKTASPVPAGLGRTINYTITVDNLGPSDAPDVTLTDTVDSRTPITGFVGDCDLFGQTDTCDLDLSVLIRPRLQ